MPSHTSSLLITHWLCHLITSNMKPSFGWRHRKSPSQVFVTRRNNASRTAGHHSFAEVEVKALDLLRAAPILVWKKPGETTFRNTHRLIDRNVHNMSGNARGDDQVAKSLLLEDLAGELGTVEDAIDCTVD
ncbi:hypothetical protein KC368_g36 [Hortaea werneckii]|nr:hypothetical protein KC368_g36 [Hortaea werneckii]